MPEEIEGMMEGMIGGRWYWNPSERSSIEPFLEDERNWIYSKVRLLPKKSES